MALVTGTIAASATPATDLFAFIHTSLTGAGWVEETTRTYTGGAAGGVMGTTATCRVYFSSTTTTPGGTLGVVGSGVYTGCILSFEIDDTNARIRVRAYEKFDSSLTVATTTGKTLTDATDDVTWNSHGLNINDLIFFTAITTTTGISINTPYYVHATGFTANAFRVAAGKGGAVITLGGGNGTADISVPARNSKWGVYGGTSGSNTPSVNGALPVTAGTGSTLADSFHAHFDSTSAAHSTTHYGAYVEISCLAAGFQYWLGSKSDMMVFATNCNGNQNVAMAGQVGSRYQGDLQTTIGQSAVFLYGAPLSSSTTCGSWTYSSASSGDACSMRVSREPFFPLSTSGNWMMGVGGAVVEGQSAAASSPPHTPYGGAGVSHRYYSAAFLAFPMWLHGYDTLASSNSSVDGRSNYAVFNECLVHMRSDMNAAVLATARAYEPNLGEQVTGGAVTYTSLGVTGAELVNSAGGHLLKTILIDGSQFS